MNQFRIDQINPTLLKTTTVPQVSVFAEETQCLCMLQETKAKACSHC